MPHARQRFWATSTHRLLLWTPSTLHLAELITMIIMGYVTSVPHGTLPLQLCQQRPLEVHNALP